MMKYSSMYEYIAHPVTLSLSKRDGLEKADSDHAHTPRRPLALRQAQRDGTLHAPRMLFSIILFITSLSPAAILQVGPGAEYASPCDASGHVQTGDTVLMAQGQYPDQACSWGADGILLKGGEAYAHVSAPAVISNQKAIWVIQGSNVTVENVEFSGASVPDQNGAGIRAEGTNLTVRGCYFHHNEDGILGGSGTMRIEHSIFEANGYGDGYSHNLYIGSIDSLIFRFNYSHHARIGHELKSRAAVNLILYNRIMNEADGTASYSIDLPNGGTSVIMGNLLQQGPDTDNPNMIHFGGEGLTHPGKDLYLSHNTLVNDRGSGNFLSIADGATCRAVSNVLVGSGSLGACIESGNASVEPMELMDAAGFDYCPAEGASFLNQMVEAGDAQGFSLTPMFQYQHPASMTARPIDGLPDAGAYEWSSAASVSAWMEFGRILRTGTSANVRDVTGRLRQTQARLMLLKN